MSRLLEAAEAPTDLTQRRLPVLGEAALKLAGLFACGMRRRLTPRCRGSWVRIRLIRFREFPDQVFRSGTLTPLAVYCLLVGLLSTVVLLS